MLTPPGNAHNLVLDPAGYWVARQRHSSDQISYPDDGNTVCYSVENDSFWFRHRNQVLVELLRRFPPGGTLFDIGGGNGFVAWGLEQADFATVLVEPGRMGAANACKRGLERIVCATIDEADFPPGSMAAIGLFDVVEHIENDFEFLANLRKLLAEQGRIYLTVPAFPWLWSFEDTCAGHFRRYTTSSLSSLLRQTGYRVEFITYFFWFLPIPVFVMRTLPTFLGWRIAPTASSTRSAHTTPGLGGWLVDRALSWELSQLRLGRALPIGGSCLAVARARN